MRDFKIIAPGQTIRLCVNLNVWVRYLLGRRGGKGGPTAASALVDAVQSGRSVAFRPISSWAEERCQPLNLKYQPTTPYDPTVVPARADDEDGRVLDTAVAGQAHIIATFNFDDFCSRNSRLLEVGRAQIYQAAHHNIMSLHAHKAAECLALGDFSWPTRGT